MRLAGKVAVITGAGQGIGRAAAELFARNGARVLILDIDRSRGTDARRSIRQAGGEAFFIETDISDPGKVEKAFATVEKEHGALHVLYNNASIFLGRRDARVTDLSPETWRRILSVNLDGLYHCCRAGLPLIARSGGGSVINTASSAAVIGIPGCDAYTASKGATVSLTRSLAVEYGPSGIRVNCIAPAAVRTAMVRQSNLDDPSFDEKRFLETAPLRRWGLPEDIAGVALFLASDESAWLNGAVIVADGGITVT